MTALLHLGRDLVRPTVALLLGLGFVVLFCSVVLGAPSSDTQLLAFFLAGSGFLSLIVGVVVMRSAATLGFAGLRARLLLAHAVVLIIVLVNVSMTAGLMFISSHDLGLLALLLLFSAIVSFSCAGIVAGQAIVTIRQLADAAREIAGGELHARVDVVGHDELADLGHTFNAMAARLDESDRLRRELEEARRGLIAAVSHDLRTPLASIRAMIEAVNDKVVSDPETVERYLVSIQNEVGRLSTLIDDLFELSRLDAGALTLNVELGSVRDLLSDTLEALHVQALAKNVRLAGHVDTDLPPVVMDASRIQRVIYNLVQNAIRHTPEHGVVVLEAQEDEGAVRVDVVDDGEGVAESDLPFIFERFYRGEKSRARGQGGAGLGLAIAKGLVEAHGGRIWAQNLPGRGARFSFLLPRVARVA